jgi:hypothetical protein
MIVTILEGEDNRMLQQADLALLKTDMETVGGQRLFEVVKNRHGPNGRYILENNIRDFVQNYERKEQKRRGREPKGPPRKTV